MNDQYRDLVFVIRDLIWVLFLTTADDSPEQARVDMLLSYIGTRIHEIESSTNDEESEAYKERAVADRQKLIAALNGLIVSTMTNINRIAADPDRPLTPILDTIRHACLEATEVADRAAGEYDHE